MKVFQVKSMVDGQPCFAVPLNDILATLKRNGALKVLSPLEYITDRQRRWYKGVCLPSLVANDENGETLGWWDVEVKRQCKGLDYLKKETHIYADGNMIGRLTTKDVGKKNMTLFIEEILSVSMVKGWPVSAPDADLRAS